MSRTKPRRLLYLQYTNPAGYPPLEHGARILQRAGWEVLFLGTGVFGQALRFPPDLESKVRRLRYCPPGWRQKVHFLKYGFWVLGWVIRWRPGWVYVSDVPACPMGWLLSWIPGLRVVYHEHDSPPSSPRVSTPWMRLLLRTRRALARRAALCVLPNAGRVHRFNEELRPLHPAVCVWNCPLREEASSSAGSVREEKEFRLVYGGSVNPVRVPLTLVEALARLPALARVDGYGYETLGSAGYLDKFMRRARDEGVGRRIHFQGTPTRSELLERYRRCRVGLVFLPLAGAGWNERTMTGASNKSFDYLASGLALLVPKRPEWEEMFVRPGYGRSCDPGDPASVAEALRWFLEHPQETRRMGEAGRRRILEEWNYERQFAPVLSVLEAGGGG